MKISAGLGGMLTEADDINDRKSNFDYFWYMFNNIWHFPKRYM